MEWLQTISDEAKLHAWKENYQRLLNVEFAWNSLTYKLPNIHDEKYKD